MIPTPLPNGSPVRYPAPVSGAISWVLAVLALVWVMHPGHLEHRLNQIWTAATTGWHWSAEAPQYRIDPTLPESVLVRVPLANGSYLDISTVYGAGLYGLTGFSAPVNDRLARLWVRLQARNAVLPTSRVSTAYWQPARYGYKQLVYKSHPMLVLDGALQAATEVKPWRIKPWFGLQVEERFRSTDWQGGVVVLNNMVPEPERHGIAITEDNLPLLATDHPLALQWLTEYEALKSDIVLVTPLWLSLFAWVAALVPWWVKPLLLRNRALIGVLIASWLSSNLLLMLLYQWWLPLWPVLLSMVAAGGVALNARRASDLWNDLVADYRQLAEERLNQLLLEGQVDAAQKLLLTKRWLSNDLGSLYKVAQAFERKRQYQAALDCYQWIVRHDPDFKDVTERQQALIGLADPKTVVKPDRNKHSVLAPVGLEQPEIGRYQLLGELGQGAMGTVYKAVDPKIERTIALKIVNLDTLSEEAMADVKLRFYREAKAAGRLNHPNIVTVFDVGEEKDLAYIAMDLIDGISLQQRLEAGDRVKVPEVCEWFAQAADALDYAHSRGIIHRDIKPANLLLDERSDQLKISDFGVARMSGNERTGTGIILGSPTYMSPEQIRGEPLLAQTDIYSLGVTLYRVLTGQLPFQGDTLPSLAYAILHEQPKSPRQLNPNVTPALVRIINRAMHKNPADRYATAGDMAQALRRRLRAD